MITSLAITGHRPDKLGGYRIPNCQFDQVTELLHKTFLELKPRTVISGMALGVDQWAAEVALDLGIHVVAAIPFEGQESNWPEESQRKYRALLRHVGAVKVVSPGGYAAWKMQYRNEWMVDHAEYVVAVWDRSPGGTANCMKYVIERGVPHRNLWEQM